MKKIVLLFAILSICVTSCSDDYEETTNTQEAIEGEIVLKERDLQYAWKPYDYHSQKKIKIKSQTNAFPGLNHRMFLGYSFKNEVYPIEDSKNLGFQVIDINKLAQDSPDYLTACKTNSGEAFYYSYASLDRYITNSKITENVSSGFKINLGLFSIGKKKSLKTVFTSAYAEDKNTVFGELNIVVQDSSYRLQMSSNIKDKIKYDYLSSDFKEELHSTHPSELFANYGGFVLVHYLTGGKATAMFAGTYNKEEKEETKEKNMNNEMDASFGFKLGGGQEASGDLSLGRGSGDSDGTSITNEFSSLMMSIKTIGGNSNFAAFSVPKEVKNTGVNLSAWVSSLNDKTTHSIIGLESEGLILLTDFVVERNLRNQIEKYYSTGVDEPESLVEPQITIELSHYQQPQVYVLSTYLHTRFGDNVELKSKFMGNMHEPNFFDKVWLYLDEEADRVTDIFRVKVTSNIFTPSSLATSQAQTYFDYDLFNKNDLRKYEHKGTIYIVSDRIIDPSHPVRGLKFALAIHKDYVIDEYVMRDFIDNPPTIDLDYNTFIRNYIIDAL